MVRKVAVHRSYNLTGSNSANPGPEYKYDFIVMGTPELFL